MQTLIDKIHIAVAHVEPFLRLADKVPSPRRLFAMVEDIAELPSFRRAGLPNLAAAIEEVAKNRPRMVEDFMSRVEGLAKLARERDGFAKGAPGWKAAQDKIKTLAEAVEKEARFGIPKAKLSPVLEEFARTGQFNWDVFRKSLTEEFPLKGHKFEPMEKMVASLKTAMGAAWVDANAGPILKWSSIVEYIHGKLADKQAAQKFIDDLHGLLLKKLKSGKADGLSQAIYKDYRHMIEDVAMEHVFRDGVAKDQHSRLTGLMKFLRDDGADNATIGEYFAEFRRNIFEKGQAREIQGALKSAEDMPDLNRALQGSKEMFDGALKVPDGTAIAHGQQKGGLFFVEDKAGGSFSLKQAKEYSTRLDGDALRNGGGTKAEGMIYFVEKPGHAGDIAQALADYDLHPNILVATFNDVSGKVEFVPRPPKAATKGMSKAGAIK